jgi:hypothetical protein
MWRYSPGWARVVPACKIILRRNCEDFFLAATETIAEPCLVVDSEGMILLWFLPGLVKSERQVSQVI